MLIRDIIALNYARVNNANIWPIIIGIGGISSANCTLCLAWTYSSSFGATAFSSCIPFPRAKFSSTQGSTSAGACNNTAKYTCAHDDDCNYPLCLAPFRAILQPPHCRDLQLTDADGGPMYQPALLVTLVAYAQG